MTHSTNAARTLLLRLLPLLVGSTAGCTELLEPLRISGSDESSGSATSSSASTSTTTTPATGDATESGTGTTTGVDSSTGGSETTMGVESTWSFHRVVEVSGLPDPEGSLHADVPVRVTLDDAFFDFGALMVPPDDIRFTTREGVPLPHEVDHWDGSTMELWVAVPEIGPDPTQVWMEYGNPAPGPPTPGVWGDAVGVWHLDDLTNSISGVADDEPGSADAAAYIGGGRSYDGGVHDELGALGSGTEGTVQFWFNGGMHRGETIVMFHATSNASAGIFEQVGQLWVGHRIEMPSIQARVLTDDNVGSSPTMTSLGDRLDDQWHHVVVIWDSAGTSYLQIDGAQIGTGINNYPGFDFTDAVRLGGLGLGFPNRYFTGLIDEVRLYPTAMSASRAEAEWRVQMPGFTSVGPEMILR